MEGGSDMKTRGIVFLVGLAVCLLFPQLSDAQWTHTGSPEGGRIKGLASNGKTVFVFAGNALLKSDNNGASWKVIRVNYGYILAVSGKVLFIGDPKYGILRSIDQGVSWNRFYLNGLGPSGYVWLAASGKDVYAKSGFAPRLYHSPDSGETWHQTNANALSNIT